jgi:hypothetical protein
VLNYFKSSDEVTSLAFKIGEGFITSLINYMLNKVYLRISSTHFNSSLDEVERSLNSLHKLLEQSKRLFIISFSSSHTKTIGAWYFGQINVGKFVLL